VIGPIFQTPDGLRSSLIHPNHASGTGIRRHQDLAVLAVVLLALTR
jgi:hypothetical protein